jgi:hypothetical protein
MAPLNLQPDKFPLLIVLAVEWIIAPSAISLAEAFDQAARAGC